MGELWSRVGERPVLNELDEETAAEVLLRAGVLTGWIGSVKQIEGDSVAHYAHLGGALFGFILVKLWGLRRNDHFL